MTRRHRDPCAVRSHYNSPVLAAAAFFAVVVYVAVTFEVTKWRQKHRRSTNKHDSAYHDIATDSLVNFETVKAFANEEHEVGRFRDAVRARDAVPSACHRLLLLRAAAAWQLRTCCCGEPPPRGRCASTRSTQRSSRRDSLC